MSLDPGFSTEASREIFGSTGRLGAMLDVEAALAVAVAASGLIRETSAEVIATACREGDFDADAILAAGWEEGSPVIPLVAALRAAVGGEHADAVHFGATTQDIVDMALMLQVRAGLEALETDVLAIGREIARLADEHRDTPRLARTLLQPAGATTFGLTAARWLDPLSRDLRRLRRARGELALQLGGAVGDQAAWGECAEAVAADVAERLGLRVPPMPWHASRDRVAGLAATLSLFCRTVAKIAHDLLLLAQAEVGEVSMRPGGSSAMPDKRNAIDAVRAVASSRFAAGQAALLLAPAADELERAAGAWQLEWAAVPNLFHGTLAAAEALRRALETLTVYPDRMASHLALLTSDATGPGEPTERLIERAIAEWSALGA